MNNTVPQEQPLNSFIDALHRSGLLSSAHQVSAHQVSTSCESTALASAADPSHTINITNVTFDSREVTPGSLFVAKGAHFEPSFLDDAVARGAVAYVTEKEYPNTPIPAIIVSDVRAAMIELGKVFYDDVMSKLTIVGVTGTKGKTTTVTMVREMLDSWLTDHGKPRAASISSAEIFDGINTIESHITTPEALDIYRYTYQAYLNGATHLILEVSSQALKYGRVAGINFEVVAFTNFSPDHISPTEHADIDDYFHSKLSIFDHAQTCCINSQTERYEEVMAYAKERCIVSTYGTKDTDDVRYADCVATPTDTTFSVSSEQYCGTFSIVMPGIFNIENAVAAIAIAQHLGIPAEYVRHSLAHTTVHGRTETYRSSDGRITVIVDYAHNKASLEAILAYTRTTYPHAAIVCLAGVHGFRSISRKKDHGEVISAYADFYFITEYNTGLDNFQNIAQETAHYTSIPYKIIEDRRVAAQEAILGNLPGIAPSRERVVLLLGRGSSTVQIRGFEEYETGSDNDYAREFLAEYNNM